LKKIKDLADLINEEKRLAESVALGASIIRRIKGKLPGDLVCILFFCLLYLSAACYLYLSISNRT